MATAKAIPPRKLIRKRVKTINLNLFLKTILFIHLVVSSVHPQSVDSTSSSRAVRHASALLYLDHWAYTYIQLLQDRGYLTELFYSVRPYKRADIASALAVISIVSLSASEKYWVELLRQELASELKWARSESGEDGAWQLKTTVQERIYSQENNLRSDFFINPEMNYSGENLSVSARGRLDRGILHDTTYEGRHSKYLAARLEDGYGLFQFGRINVLIGRVAQNWSPFNHQSLILSDNPYTYDQVGFMYTTRHIAIHSVFAKLNSIQTANRFFSAHRLDIKLNNGINLGFSETVVFGGVHQGLELSYLNPFTIFANAQLNEGKEANETLAFDFFIPISHTNFKGQILIDDFVLDGSDKPPPNRKTSPDRLGFVFGVQRNDLVISNSQINLTYERVGSYTYNVKQKRSLQTYTLFERGLGASSNDHDAWKLNWKYFPFAKFIFNFDLEWSRTGTRNLQSNNFEDSTFVKLAFPSGVVTKTLRADCRALYQHSKNIFIEGVIGFENVMNFGHVPKRHKTFVDCELRLQWAFSACSEFP